MDCHFGRFAQATNLFTPIVGWGTSVSSTNKKRKKVRGKGSEGKNGAYEKRGGETRTIGLFTGG